MRPEFGTRLQRPPPRPPWAVAVLASVVLAAGGCSTGGAGSAEASKGLNEATIGVLVPLTGDQSVLGVGVQHAVELAVSQANADSAIPGWTLKASPRDDKATPSTGADEASRLVADASVVAVVGAMNSHVTAAVQPVFAQAEIPLVSPSNTNPALTRGRRPTTAPSRPYPNFFRTIATDDKQPGFAARHLMAHTERHKVAVIHDGSAYGQHAATAFQTQFSELGGTVVATKPIDAASGDHSAVVRQLIQAAPEAVFFGGNAPQAGPLSRQMKAAGLDIPLMGTDSLYSATYPELAGEGAAGDLATSVVTPPDRLPGGAAFLAEFSSSGFQDPAQAYGAYAYDAATAIIEALKISLAETTDVAVARPATVHALSSVSFDGVAGTVSFDEFGDTTSQVLTVYTVSETKSWVPMSSRTT